MGKTGCNMFGERVLPYHVYIWVAGGERHSLGETPAPSANTCHSISTGDGVMHCGARGNKHGMWQNMAQDFSEKVFVSRLLNMVLHGRMTTI